ncbi:MAG: Smr/MutS family protein [Desulfobulbaceae bacterium]|jgi:hypothetical protein|nr:Smr/MutS family protein [Desulfobulbaceae bacterium]
MDCPCCGNSQAGNDGRCPYCGETLAETFADLPAPMAFCYRQVSIKEGMPSVDEALRLLTASIGAAQTRGVRVLSVVHGYGSSGKGGIIRDECRKYLDILRGKGEIADFIHGENLGKRRPQGKNLLKRFPQLDNYRDCQVSNPGVTMVVL